MATTLDATSSTLKVSAGWAARAAALRSVLSKYLSSAAIKVGVSNIFGVTSAGGDSCSQTTQCRNAQVDELRLEPRYSSFSGYGRLELEGRICTGSSH